MDAGVVTHGDVVLTTNSSGTAVGTIGSYDPFGNPLGSTNPDNSDGNWDYGWHGNAQKGLEHDANLIPTIQMGARPCQTQGVALRQEIASALEDMN